MDKPSLPKGTRDFGPAVMAKRQFIFNTIRGVFQKFGFQPLETPAMENLSTLTGKYGEEGDQLLFRVLDSGEYFEKAKNSIAIPDDKSVYKFAGICAKSYDDAIHEVYFMRDPKLSGNDFFYKLFRTF